jgi:hypothetical protein
MTERKKAAGQATVPEPEDAASQIEAYFEKGWTDGLPVVPPTEAAVGRALAAAGLTGTEVIGTIPGRNVRVTADKVAINAILAGCKPEYLPVVIAAIRALCHPSFAYHGPASSTGGSAMVVIASGPLAETLGINSGNNAFGQGWRPNATIGRAVRLTMMNAMNTRPGLLDRATLGNPGKYGFCFAENGSYRPWESFHVWRGFRPEQSTVTVYASNSLNQVYNQLATEPEPLLLGIADALCHLGVPNILGYNQSLVVLAGEHSTILGHAGWSRRRTQEFLVEHARRRVADFKRAARLPGEIAESDEATWRQVFRDPEDLLIVCAGGEAGSWSACLPGWGKKWTRAVTVEIVSGRAEPQVTA